MPSLSCSVNFVDSERQSRGSENHPINSQIRVLTFRPNTHRLMKNFMLAEIDLNFACSYEAQQLQMLMSAATEVLPHSVLKITYLYSSALIRTYHYPMHRLKILMARAYSIFAYASIRVHKQRSG